jgi:hypothetical protein
MKSILFMGKKMKSSSLSNLSEFKEAVRQELRVEAMPISILMGSVSCGNIFLKDFYQMVDVLSSIYTIFRMSQDERNVF